MKDISSGPPATLLVNYCMSSSREAKKVQLRDFLCNSSPIIQRITTNDETKCLALIKWPFIVLLPDIK